MRIGFIFDVTLLAYALADRVTIMRREREKAEAEAIRASHLAMLGELSAGVAHEINTPVNTIINSADLLLESEDRASMEHDAGLIKKEGRRIATIVRSLLFFAHQKDEEKISRPVSELIAETLNIVETKLRKDGIELSIRTAPDLHEVIVHPQQLEQVFPNIINNAAYALNERHEADHDGKTLEISAGNIAVEGRAYVRVAFTDRGAGIPHAILDKVMNPFFTTKKAGAGTGPGLSISRDIILKHGGTMGIESVEGDHTKVIIDLPAAE